MLDLPRHGNINLHGSLLPKYRGAAPIQWAVANGETVTGVTTMRLDAGLDTGPMLLAQAIPVGQEETAADVYENLAEVGAPLMVETLRRLEAGDVKPTDQNHALATYAPILTREDGLIDFKRTAREIYNRWRGFQPWPGAFTTLRGKKLIIHRMHPVQDHSLADCGAIWVEAETLCTSCGSFTTLAIDEVQPEGKRRMSVAEFLRGYQLNSGERLGG
jgi:methionyl-tRNA formyltransferase